MPRFDPARGTLAGFLSGIARNRVLRILEQRHPGEQPVDFDPVDGAGHPLDNIVRDGTVDQVRRAVLALPLAYREVVILCDLEERPYEESAAILGCPVGTVRSRLHRARKLLLDRLEPVIAGRGKE